MDQDRLREVIKKGESETVEFKENFDKETIETVGAFANTKGGRRITNKEYQEMYGIKKRQTSEDLKDLQDKKIFERVDTTGKGTYYTLKGAVKGRKGQ